LSLGSILSTARTGKEEGREEGKQDILKVVFKKSYISQAVDGSHLKS
jgi:hypothetical protein